MSGTPTTLRGGSVDGILVSSGASAISHGERGQVTFDVTLTGESVHDDERAGGGWCKERPGR